MSMLEGLMAELMNEAEATRRMLEVCPDDKLTFKPHDKSMDLAHLAGHVAGIPEWGTTMLTGEHFDLNAGAEQDRPAAPTSNKELLARFETSLDQFKDAAAKLDNAAMMEPWQLRKGDQVLMEMPRIACVRSFVMNHIIHHRGQLSVYLRMLDVALPKVYGPTADDQSF